MPMLKIFTNLTTDKIPNDFVVKILPLLARVLRKPEQNFACMVAPDCALSLEGTSNVPGALATIESIGHLGPQYNSLIAKEITAFVEKELGIEPNRFILTFYDLQANNVAKGGKTVG